MITRAVVCLLAVAIALGFVAPAVAQPAPAPSPVTIELPSVGTLHLARPPAMAIGDNLTFDVGGTPVGLGINASDHGACAYDAALVMVKLGKAANRDFAPGYWGTVVDQEGAAPSVYGCLDLREGYLVVLVNPAPQLGAVQDVLAEVRRAAYAKHGAPIASDVDPVVLPHTDQRVSLRGPGSWKVVDGARDKKPGGDLFLSTDPLGRTGTFYSVAVVEEPCAPGATPLDPATSSALFPSELGTTWVDASEYKLRWSAWACVASGGQGATVTVLAAFGDDDPPAARDVTALRPVIDAIARSYGLAIGPMYDPGPGGGSSSSSGRPDAIGGTYLGILSFAPAGEGDRRVGVLFGFEFRIFKRDGGVRPGFVLDAELGYGAGEFLGELRAGAGAGLGPLELVLGASVGSTGPAAALDGYAQAGLMLRPGRRRVWLGALRAVGVGGPDHDQLDLKVIFPGKDDSGLYFGARYLRFGDGEPDFEGGPAIENGTAIMVSFGGGLATRD